MNTLAPFFGGYDGGTLAVITGTNLHPNINNSTKGAARCRFTSSISNFTATVVPSFVSNSQVSCTTPKLPTSLRFDGAQLNTGDVPVAIQFTSNGIDYYTSRSILFSLDLLRAPLDFFEFSFGFFPQKRTRGGEFFLDFPPSQKL